MFGKCLKSEDDRTIKLDSFLSEIRSRRNSFRVSARNRHAIHLTLEEPFSLAAIKLDDISATGLSFTSQTMLNLYEGQIIEVGIHSSNLKEGPLYPTLRTIRTASSLKGVYSASFCDNDGCTMQQIQTLVMQSQLQNLKYAAKVRR